MDKKTCECVEFKWECWIKEYDSNQPDIIPSLWFSKECVLCGELNYIPHSEVDESIVPKHIIERGLLGLKRYREEK